MTRRRRSKPRREPSAATPTRPGAAARTSPGGTWAILVSGGLGLAVVLVYAQLRQHAFLHFDDDAYIYQNPHVFTGLRAANLAWALTAFHSNNWHPLTWMSHMLDVQLFGLDAGAHHMVNVLLHAANAVLVFLLLWRMTGARWRSALVAAAFALHPLRVESVAWASERKDVLSALFGLLTIGAYAWYARRPDLARYTLVLLCFALGLLAKPMLVTLPFVLLLLDYWPLGRLGPAATGSRTLPWLDKLPMLALVVASSLLTLAAQSSSGIVQSLEAVSLPMRVANALVSVVRYAFKLLLPVHQAFYYPYPSAVPMLEAAAALLLIVAVTFACWRARRRRPYLLVGWLWYLGMLVPVIGLVQVASQAMAERYTYLPSVGFMIALTWGVADLVQERPGARRAAIAVAVLALCVLAAKTRAQAAYWRDGITLFSRDTLVQRDNILAYRNLGAALADSGRNAEALPLLLKVLPHDPSDAVTLYDIGALHERLGRNEEAIAWFRRAIRSRPGMATAHYRLATSLSHAGRPAEAIPEFREVLRLQPDLMEAYNGLGIAQALAGDREASIATFRRALEIRPGYVEAHFNLGNVFRSMGRDTAAVAEYEAALRANPQFAPAELNLSLVYLARGDTTSMRIHFARALQLDPDIAARNGLVPPGRGISGTPSRP